VCSRRGKSRCRALLHHVGQLVREQAIPVGPSRGIAASAEHDVVSEGVGVGTECARRFGGMLVAMDAHPAEVEAKAWFEERPCGGVECLTG
jgi:hypothetical protein